MARTSIRIATQLPAEMLAPVREAFPDLSLIHI